MTFTSGQTGHIAEHNAITAEQVAVTAALEARALASNLATTDALVAQKVTATLYNGIDVKVTPVGGGAYLTGGTLEIQLLT